MWSYEYSADTSATPETIWPFFEDVAGWPTWNQDIERIVLEGPFVLSWPSSHPQGAYAARWSSAGCWLPGLPARWWLLLRYASKHRRQNLLGLVDPGPQEPPVPPGRQRFVLGVYGRDQLLEQAADLSGPVASLVVGRALGQQLPAAREVNQGGPQRWPRQGSLPRVLRGQDRRQLGAGGGAGVSLQRTGLGVPG